MELNGLDVGGIELDRQGGLLQGLIEEYRSD